MEKVKILAIDDTADNLIVLKALLTEAFPKAIFISAQSGIKGIELCLSEKPDVILLDIVMPVMDGYEVCQIIKANEATKSIPVVMVTAARTDRESRIKALEYGADAFLTKPVDESELTAQIRAMLRIKESEDRKLDEKERLKRLVEERTSQLEAELNERKRTEKALKHSEERFQMLFNQAPLGYQSLDFDGCFIEVNKQWSDTLGFSREEVIGKWFGDFLSPEYQEGFRKRFLLFKAQGHIHSEFEMVHKNGSKLFIAFEGNIGYNLEGGFKQTHCILQDITQRKKTEEALTESEEKHSILFKNSPDSYLIISEGIFVDCNQATEVMLRGGRTQIIGQTPDNISPEIQPDGKKSSDSAAEKINWALEHGKNTFEWMHRRFDGSDLYVEVSIAPMKLKGKLTLFTTWRDISVRKLAEKALKESEAQFREFFEKAADAIFIVDFETGMIVDVNEAATLLMNRSYEQLIGIHESQLHPPLMGNYSKDTFNRHKEMVKQNLSSYALENTVVRADGIEVPVEILAAEVTFKGKRCLHGTFRNITERKKSEKEIQESEAKYRYMFQHNPQPMWIYDHDTLEILEVNNVSTNIYGYSREEFLSMTIKDIRPAEDIPLMLKDVEESRLDENSIGEWRHVKKSGEIINVDISASSIIFDGRKARHVLIKDITERKQAEKELREVNDRFSELVASTDGIVWEADAKTFTFSFVSKNAERILGYETEDWLQPGFWANHIFEDDKNNTVQFCVDQTNLCSNHDFEYRFLAKDGRTVWLADFVKVIEENGKPKWLHGLLVDITERKKAEIALKESEERYRSFISQVSEGVYRFECDQPMDLNLPLEEQIDFIYDHMFIAEFNDAGLKMYGISNQSEMIGKGHLDFHGGRNNPVNRDSLRRFIQNGFHIENAITEEVNALGQLMFISNNSLGIIEHNQLVRMWGTQTDITDQMRADQVQQVLYTISNAAFSTSNLNELIQLISKEVGKLLDSTNFYIAFYDEQTNTLSTIYERDEKDVIDTWPSENSITGYIIKQHKSLLLREEDVPQFYKDFGIQQFGTPAKVWMGVPLTIANKTIGAIVVQSYDNPDAYTEKDKQVLEFISHQISISIERKKAEAEIIEKELQYRNLADSGMALIWTADTDKLCKYFNEPWFKFTGRTFEQEYGYGWADGVHPDDLGHCVKTYDTAFDKRESFEMEYRLRHVSGEYRWLLDLGSPNYNSEGKFIGYIGHCFDITDLHQIQIDLRNAKEKAEESDRLKSSFLANMSHEIRTPLNSIIGFSELLLDPDFEKEQHHEFARMINTSGNGLLAIISDIMDLSKIEAGQLELKKGILSVQKLINDIQNEYSFKAIENGIELRLDPLNPKEQIYLESDESKLRQILINFVGNAIKFTEQGIIEIGVRLKGDSVQFYVKDSGIGISQEHHDKIFERFRQVETSNTRKYGGNGLGLAISKSLVVLLGGEIGMESEQGKGSTFYFTIPLRP